MENAINYWIPIVDKYKDSVIQIKCVRAIYKPFRPYLNPLDTDVSGSGFIIDILNGLVVTNAHVVENAITINGRTRKLGEYDLILTLISICREKDIAICQITKESLQVFLQDIIEPTNINMEFGDSLLVRETEEVIAMGYPLGKKGTKYTTGVISGFYANIPNDNDWINNDILSDEDEPSYIQITAPINPGNSGGPLVNRSGKVIGINAAGYLFSQNVAYAITSRTFMSIYRHMITPLTTKGVSIPYIFVSPRYSFEYNKTSPDLYKVSCRSSDTKGIYVKRVYPNSCFQDLQEGDIITEISYNDMYINMLNLSFQTTRNQNKGIKVIGKIDQFGDIKIITNDKRFSHLDKERRSLSIKELFDYMPVGEKVDLTVCRTGNEKLNSRVITITDYFDFKTTPMIKYLYPRIHPYRYEIIAGLCIGELTINHINEESNDNLGHYIRGIKRYQPRLVINQIFPGTTAHQIKIFKEGDIVGKVNNCLVNTIDDLRGSVAMDSDYITIINKEKNKFVIKRETAWKEDMAAIKLFEIKNSHLKDARTEGCAPD